MTYNELRDSIKTGDVLLLEGRHFFSRIVRVFTGQQASHVALFVWLDDGLWIAEMLTSSGYTLTPASDRIPQISDQMYLGVAPAVVRDGASAAKSVVMKYRERGKRYGFYSLLKVWWAQLWQSRPDTEQRVCSTFVQEVWEACGFKFNQLADPGDFFRLCEYTIPVKRGET